MGIKERHCKLPILLPVMASHGPRSEYILTVIWDL